MEEQLPEETPPESDEPGEGEDDGPEPWAKASSGDADDVSD